MSCFSRICFTLQLSRAALSLHGGSWLCLLLEQPAPSCSLGKSRAIRLLSESSLVHWLVLCLCMHRCQLPGASNHQKPCKKLPLIHYWQTAQEVHDMQTRQLVAGFSPKAGHPVFWKLSSQFCQLQLFISFLIVLHHHTQTTWLLKNAQVMQRTSKPTKVFLEDICCKSFKAYFCAGGTLIIYYRS